MQLVGESKRHGRRRESIDLVLHVPRGISAAAMNQALAASFLCLHDHDAGIFRPVHAAEFGELVVFVLGQFSVHQDYGFGAMIARVDGLGDQLRMLRQPGISALGCESRGLVAQEQHNFVFDVQMRA